MKQTYDFLASELQKRNIRLSKRRLKVLKYLCQNRNHPTVDQIFINIQKDVPNLSKTTIYNTLHVLYDAGLVSVIGIDDNEARYDIMVEPHGHFRCEACGAILDFKTELGFHEPAELAGFKIIDKHVYFKGLCPRCLSK